MHAFMGKVPDFFTVVEKKFHAYAAARNILLLLYRSERKPAPQLLLAFRFILHDGHGERPQFARDHHLAVRWLKHNGKLLRLTDFG